MQRNRAHRVLKTMLTASLAACLSVASSLAHAVTAEELLELLKRKGIITQEEYEILLKAPAATPERPARLPPKDPAAPASRATTEKTEKEAHKNAASGEITATFKDGVTWESADQEHLDRAARTHRSRLSRLRRR
jgi:hypothetical protein